MISDRSNFVFFVVIVTVMTSLVVSAANTWYVSPSGNDSNSGKMETSAFKTIQKAIDSAAAKDTVLVKEGTYSRITIPKSKAGLVVRAVGSAEKTIIQGPGRCVTIADGTVTNIYVEGFTLTGGTRSGSGNNGAGALGGTYNNCIITGNQSGSLTTGGGAVDCTLNGCTISNNTCSDWVGGIENCIASNCVIKGNKSTNQGSGGAKKCILIDCRISGNSGGYGGGGAQDCILYRCRLWGNTQAVGDLSGKEITGGKAYDCVISGNAGKRIVVAADCYNCTIVATSGNPSIWRGTTLYNCIVASTGNEFTINGDQNWYVNLKNCVLYNVSLGSCVSKSSCTTANPKLVSTSNFNLQSTSPCIDKGNNSYVTTTRDYLGKKRIINGKVDIGACEYQPPVFSVETVSAVQRYPWNGLVEVQFKFTEANNNTGLVTLSAKDVIGNTNLPVKTIYKSNGTVANMTGESISPGSYKWVWNATEDLPKNFKRERVTVSVKVANETGTSGEFRMDLSGMGPWEMRTAAASEAISYSTAWATNALTDAKAVVKVYPVKREKPKYIAIDLSGGTTATHYPIECFDEISGGSWSDEYKTSKLVLRHIPAGSFIMGGRATDYPGAVNTNLHMVTLTKDFYMGVFEVTQRQWELVMGNRPSAFSNETCYATRPVDKVSYLDIRGAVQGALWPRATECDDNSFLGVLSSKSALRNLDLPTDAQWEYACRAGTTTALNIGKDISSAQNVLECPELMTNARFRGNSNYSNMTNPERFACTDAYCSAKVGSYTPNAWGLYDMHGNLWEWCLDRATWLPGGAIDPIGTGDSNISRRILRGGGYNELAWRCRSAFRYSDGNGMGYPQEARPETVGFRLCLQGGEIPESTEGTLLVNAAGEGSANWTPTKAGTYYLTHETQTNGVNGAELLGAWFEVAGPELTFTPDGDLTPGVKIAINGAGEGWHVYYTLDGSVPTQSSASEYTAPITLNDSQTIRAIAFSDGGLESREFSATYSLMSIGSAVAKPRYPWNGKVDIDCEVKGDANLEYLVSLSALDLDGNTNLPVRTAWLTGGSTTNNAFLVKPGNYRFTWDADADIAGDFDFANVAVRVSAANTAITGAKRTVTFTVDGYTGTEVLTNVPVLVRLSTAIEGFSYADFADADGGDMVFCDEGESVIYPHEIDEWHVGGESLVWVRLPEMKQGTKFKLAYGNPNYSLSTITSSLSPHEVWRDYAGVWHMNEDSGVAYDSTAHGLDAVPSKGTNTLADTSQMVAYENGACGRARVNGTQNGKGLNYLCTPASYKFAFGGEFVVAGWFRVENLIANGTGFDDPRLISMKREYISQRTGFELQFEDGADKFGCKAQTNSFVAVQTLSAMKSWVCLVANFDSTNVLIYANGNFVTNGTIKAVVDDPEPIVAIGSSPSGVMWSLNGQYDEIRLRGGALSADRIKADYDMIVNRNFLKASAVALGEGVDDSLRMVLLTARRHITLSVDGYAGSETLTNVPTLVRLSSSISEFHYSDFADANGGDMLFTDESGLVVYPHEIDEWNVGGESLVWVKLPEMKAGTKFKLWYGGEALKDWSSVAGFRNGLKHEVWRDYAGVWHMNEDSGTAFDSTAHGLDALPAKGTNTLADISQMVAYEIGACGRARVNGNADITSGNYLKVPSYDALGLGNSFVFSGWLKKNSKGNHPRFVSRKRLTWDGNDGWEISTGMQDFSVRAASSDFLNCSSPNMGNWTMLCVKYSGNHVTAYTNGALAASATLDATATDNQMSLAFGGFQGKDSSTSLNGQYDEIRLRGGSLSAARIKADYDMINNRNFLTYGPVESGRGAE